MSQSPISNLQSPPGFAPGPLKKLFADRQDRRFWQSEGIKHSYLYWVRAMLTEEVEPPPFVERGAWSVERPSFATPQNSMPDDLSQRLGDARARGVAYGFVANAWNYPSKEMWAAFSAPQFSATLATAWTRLTGDASSAETFAGLFSADLEKLREEYTRLFYDTYLPFIPPYESVYYNERQVMGKRAASVMEFYRRAGLAAEGEMPDHIAHECEFVAHLAREETTARENGDDARARELLELQNKFLSEHLLPWGVKFCADLATLARGEFYATTARLGNALFNAEWAHSQIVT